MRVWSHVGIALAACLAGCVSPGSGHFAGSVPSSAESAALAGRAGLSTDEIQRASAIYNLKCARCHKFYNPAVYDEGEWKSWMTKMSRKARLSPEQEQLLSRYLGAFRSVGGDPTNKPAENQ